MTQEAQVQETLDFRIERLGAPRYPSPMRSVQFVRDDEQVLYHGDLAEVRAYLDRGRDAAGDGKGGAARAAVLRPGEPALRHRHLRRAVPGHQRRDPRHHLEPALPLWRADRAGVPLRLRGAEPGVWPRAAAADARQCGADQHAGRHRAGLLAWGAAGADHGGRTRAARRQHPVYHRRRRHAARGGRDRGRESSGGGWRLRSSASPRRSTTISRTFTSRLDSRRRPPRRRRRSRRRTRRRWRRGTGSGWSS